MALPYAFVLIGLVLLYYGAEWLVGASARLAIRFGITPFIVGLTVVALGTSAPEFVVSVQSTLAGVGGLALGNVLGSNIFNTAAVLGTAALICPILISKQFFKFDFIALVIVSIAVCYFISDGVVRVFEGIVLLTLFTGYMGYNIIKSSKKRGAGKTDDNVADGICIADPKSVPILKNAILVIAGLAGLVSGGHVLVLGAVDLARSWGVSEAVIGLTIVSFGTSLPEFAASAVAAFRKHGDIAIGNVVGSNMFNMLAILGTVGAMGPTETTGIVTRDLVFLCVVMFMLFIPLLSKHVLTRWAGAAFVGVYGAYIFLIVLGLM